MNKEELRDIQTKAMRRFHEEDEEIKEYFRHQIAELIKKRTNEYINTGYLKKLASEGKRSALILQWPLGFFESFKHQDLVVPRLIPKFQCDIIKEALKEITNPKVEYSYAALKWRRRGETEGLQDVKFMQNGK